MSSRQLRYDGCEVLKDGGRECTGLRLPTAAPPRPDDRFHTVVAGDRLDLLAYRHLGDASLWWVICDCNDLAFPLEAITDTTLRIQSSDYLTE